MGTGILRDLNVLQDVTLCKGVFRWSYFWCVERIRKRTIHSFRLAIQIKRNLNSFLCVIFFGLEVSSSHIWLLDHNKFELMSLYWGNSFVALLVMVTMVSNRLLSAFRWAPTGWPLQDIDYHWVQTFTSVLSNKQYVICAGSVWSGQYFSGGSVVDYCWSSLSSSRSRAAVANL